MEHVRPLIDSAPLSPSALDACAQEPIHIPGSIQPHGFFLLAEPETRRVTVASENAADFLQLPLKLILGASLDAILPREVLTSVSVVQDAIRPAVASTYLGAFRIGAEMFSVLSHCVESSTALEFERVDRVVNPELMNAVVTNFVATLGSVPSQQALAEAITRQIQELTGMDRIMLYSFDDEGNGTVLAESGNGRLPSYLDLRFPGTDIPAQARALYLRNTTRIIPDSHYRPSPLRGLPEVEAALVDLSQSTLRSVSPIHLEYMQNMGTAASMSVSLVVDGKLWGLISCHHAEPLTVPYLIRSACDMLAKMASTQLMALRAADRLNLTVRFHEAQRKILTRIAADAHYLQSLRDYLPELLRIPDAAGVALLTDDGVNSFGLVPGEEHIRRLGDWFDTQRELDVFHTDELSSLVPWGEALRPPASGVLAVRISAVLKRYLIWFRPELVETVKWAGPPATPDDPKHLSPRKSFETWKQTVHGRALPWTELEIQSAVEFRSALTIIGLRRAEEAIELGEARFQQLTSALPAKIFVCDDEGRLTFVNRRWSAQGLSSSGCWFDDAMLSPDDAARCRDIWHLAVEQNRPFEAEVQVYDKQHATARWNLVTAVPFQRERAARAGWIGTFTDLTDAKEREMALRVNEKLALSGRMTSVIAHEINNPLEAITNLMFLLRAQVPAAGPAPSYIAMVESELERISGITKQTLRWNRENSDRVENFKAGALVDDVMRLFAGKIRNRHVRVDIHGDRDTALKGIIGQIRQVLANLLSNALDAAPLQSTVHVDLIQTPEGNGFRVRDEGEGMSPPVLQKLFEPFYTTKGDLGNGLGLYITREIVERHGGQILVDSTPGAGTTMSVLLPATHSEANTAHSASR